MSEDDAQRLRLTPNMPHGALPGCPGQIELDIERNNCGSWSVPCSLDLTLDCEAPGCWWSRAFDGPVDAALFAAAEREHAACAGADS